MTVSFTSKLALKRLCDTTYNHTLKTKNSALDWCHGSQKAKKALAAPQNRV